jgi:hypothetical protein
LVTQVRFPFPLSVSLTSFHDYINLAPSVEQPCSTD